MGDPFEVFSGSGEFLGKLTPPSEGDGLSGCIFNLFVGLILFYLAVAAFAILVLPVGTLYATWVLIKNSAQGELKLGHLLLVILLWILVLGISIALIVESNNSKHTSQPSNSAMPSVQSPSQTSRPVTTIPTYTVARIQYGQEVAGTINTSNDYYDYKFTGQAGDIITIRMSQYGSTSLNPDMDLLDPSGSLAVNGDGWGNRPRPIQNYALRLSGIYTIHVYATLYPGYSGTTGEYRLTLTALPPAGSLTYGQAVTGIIVQSGDFRDWKFTGQKGDIITIRMLQDGGTSLRPRMELRDPNYSNIANAEGNDGRIQNYTLPFSGTYSIRVNGTNSSTGGYKLSLALKPPPGSIAYGQEAVGMIAISDDYQDWKFTGQAGDIITIRTLQDGGTSLRPRMELRDPSDSNIANAEGNDGRIQNYTLPFSGTYTIHAYGGGTTGGYKLILDLKPPPGSIAYGQEAVGMIAISDDYQDWKFTGQAGDIITIRMSQDGGTSLYPYMDLLDPSRSKVASANGKDARIQNYTLSFSGTYTIHAYGGGTGGYRLSLTKQ